MYIEINFFSTDNLEFKVNLICNYTYNVHKLKKKLCEIRNNSYTSIHVISTKQKL